VLRSRRGVGDLDGAEDLLREELAREARLLVGDHGGVVAAANVTQEAFGRGVQPAHHTRGVEDVARHADRLQRALDVRSHLLQHLDQSPPRRRTGQTSEAGAVRLLGEDHRHLLADVEGHRTEAGLPSPLADRIQEQLHPPVIRVNTDGHEVRLRAPDDVRVPILVEPVTQLQAEGEVDDFEQDGLVHPLSFAGARTALTDPFVSFFACSSPVGYSPRG